MSTARLVVQSWDLLLNEYPTFLLAVLVHSLRNVVITGFVLYCTVRSPWSPTIIVATLIMLSVISYFEFPSICLTMVRGQPVTLLKMPNLAMLVNWLLSTVCFCIALVTGLLFLLIPGLIVAVYLSVYGFAIFDGDGPFQSLRNSCRIVRGMFWQVFLLAAIFLTPLLLFSSPLLLGLDVTLDLAMTLAFATIYTTRRPALMVDKNA